MKEPLVVLDSQRTLNVVLRDPQIDFDSGDDSPTEIRRLDTVSSENTNVRRMTTDVKRMGTHL